MLIKTLTVATVLRIACLAQVCTILTPDNCGTTGAYAGPPTLQTFVAGLSTALPAALAAVAARPQPKTIYSGQVVAASQTFMTYDPHSCPKPGYPTCKYNNPTIINNWIDSLVTPPPYGAGLSSLDINIWPSPLFMSAQYLASGLNYCGKYGACYTPTASNQTWFSLGLTTYDAMFAHLAAAWPGVKVRIAPMISGDAMTTCGIAQGSYTEAQVQACLSPLWAAAAKRWKINDFTVWHENCGVAYLTLQAETGNTNGCAMSIGDEDTMIKALAAAVRATSQNASIRIGAGAIITDGAGACPKGPATGYPAASTNSWCDWYTNLMPSNVLDFGGVDAYPVSSIPSANYNNTLATFATMASHVTSIGKAMVANESSAMRWEAPSSTGEGATYLGCMSPEWRVDGTFMAWAGAVPGAWASANRFSVFSLFPTETLLYESQTSSTHCTNSDPAEWALVAALATGKSISLLGKLYGAVAAGWNTSLQGQSHLSGNAHLGH